VPLCRLITNKFPYNILTTVFKSPTQLQQLTFLLRAFSYCDRDLNLTWTSMQTCSSKVHTGSHRQTRTRPIALPETLNCNCNWVICILKTESASQNNHASRKQNIHSSIFQFMQTGTSAGFWLGGRYPLAAWGEDNFENLTTKWCIREYIWINMWSAQRRSLHLPALIALKI